MLMFTKELKIEFSLGLDLNTQKGYRLFEKQKKKKKTQETDFYSR